MKSIMLVLAAAALLAVGCSVDTSQLDSLDGYRTWHSLVKTGDVPGHGDTCYPAVIPLSRDRYLVYNYTSPLSYPDEPWGTALLHGPTLIYRTTLTFR